MGKDNIEPVYATTPSQPAVYNVVITIVIILLFCYFREYVRKALVYMVAGKSTEAVIYHRVSA